MWRGKFETCPVSARGRARTRLRAFEGSDLLYVAVDALRWLGYFNMNYVWTEMSAKRLKCVYIHLIHKIVRTSYICEQREYYLLC
ncbi:hypothetical protein Ae707Ps1_6287c [Pseudonocardia sp. Ae707_Ps1]|nr:hypothetical protein Ae707Ps1_6287c [Pseudonocardia sp. Ae707_Ps1]